MNIDYFMKEALNQAQCAFDNGEVPVGGVLVDINQNKIISKSFNKMNEERNAISHCEIDLIVKGCKNLSSKYLNNTIMFVTLEPCLMCASAICQAHIEKLYFGAYDEKNGGLEKYKSFLNTKHIFKTEIYGGIMEKDCKNLLKNFFANLRK